MSHLGWEAGHGRHNTRRGVWDTGNRGSAHDEANITQGMAARLHADSLALGHRSFVIQDTLLKSRDDIAAAKNPDFFLSIHTNAFNKRATGVEVWVDARASARAIAIAKDICARLSKIMGIPNRGVKRNWWSVLVKGKHDALVEMMFQDNGKDFAAYQKNVDAIELAILNAVLKGTGNAEAKTLPRKAAKAPAVAAKPAPKPSTRYAEVTASALNVRNKAGMSGKVIALLKRGQIVQTGELRSGWRRIAKPAGWVADRYLRGVK